MSSKASAQVASGETVAQGLSMPHSPRLHDGTLYVLQSGKGLFGRIDPATGAYRYTERDAAIPGAAIPQVPKSLAGSTLSACHDRDNAQGSESGYILFYQARHTSTPVHHTLANFLSKVIFFYVLPGP
jgi:hypothetical protein